jgi:hypothetical protein
MKTTPRILLLACGLLVSYNLMLKFPHVERFFLVLASQGESNRVTAEALWDSRPIFSPHSIVIAGSSMSLRLNMQELGPAFCNLSFNGGSVLTGPELISRSEDVPSCVIIETNAITRPRDDRFGTQVTGGFSKILRHYLPGFETRFRPANLVVSKVIFRGINHAALSLKTANGAAQNDTPTSNDTFRKSPIEMVRDDYSIVPDDETLDDIVAEIAKTVMTLQSRGVQVVFMELPIESGLSDDPEPTAIRAVLQKRFPPDRYPWISPAAGEIYTTTDGIHLESSAAGRLSRMVKQRLDEILKPQVESS